MRIPYLKWITYAIMPLVYDQSLSYVELLNKVVAKLNEVIEQTNNLSTHIDSVLAEWLETPEAQAAIQESIGKYIDEYAKTPDFNTILVNALSTQSEEITAAARSAAETWLNSAAGQSAIGADVGKYMEVYINTDAFKELVSGFVASLDDIKRGDELDIRQRKNVSIAAPTVVIDGCPIANDYSKSPGYKLMVTTDGIHAIHGNIPILSTIDETLKILSPVDMSKKLIMNVADPVSPADAANKSYVDSRISGGGGGGGIKYIQLTFSAADNRYHSRETFTEVMAAYPNVAAVFAAGNRDVFFPILTDGASIVFGAVTITEGNNVKLSIARRVTLNSDNVWTYTEVNDSNANYVRTNGSVPFTASQSMGGNRLVSLADPVNDNDAATLKTVRNAAGIVLRGTATFNSDGTITNVEGVDYSSVVAAALANTNILLVLTASNVEETYMVMRYVGRKQLATSGSNRYRFTFIGADSAGLSLGAMPVGNVYGLDFDEGDDPMRENDAYFISRGICDFHVAGTGSQNGALESVTFKAGYSKADFDNLLAHGARVRLVVKITGETRYFEMCYTTPGGVTAFGGIYEAEDQTVNTQIITYNGTNFTV